MFAGGREIHAPADRVHAVHAHLDRVAEPQRRAGPLAVQDRALLVELPPLALAVTAAAPPSAVAAVPVAPARVRAPTRVGGRGRSQQADGEHALERTPPAASWGAGSASATASPAARPKATNAPAEISPVISPANACSGSPRRSSRSSAKQRATSSASRSMIIASRSRSEVHAPSSTSSPARGAVSPAPIADSSARWQTRSG